MMGGVHPKCQSFHNEMKYFLKRKKRKQLNESFGIPLDMAWRKIGFYNWDDPKSKTSCIEESETCGMNPNSGLWSIVEFNSLS